MKILHLREKDYKTSRWSGGTTTELFIWPEGADYAKRAFSFRVSSAVVELAESDFTPLEGVTRYITPLTGGFTLTHPGKAPVVMEPLDGPYRFSGQEATHCVGSATDFNLMLKGVGGEMAVCSGSAAIRPGFNSFYALEDGGVTLEGSHPMKAGEMLVIFAEEAAAIDLGNTKTIACWAEI